MAADQAQFQQILSTLLNSDNDIRTQAEKAYNDLPVQVRVFCLLNIIQTPTCREDERLFCAVLLRRLFATDFKEVYPSLPAEVQEDLKSRVTHMIQADQSDSLRRKGCDVIAELARNFIDDDGDNKWPEFFEFLFKCANSQSPILRESALRMFTSAPGIFGTQQPCYMEVIKHMLQQSLLDESCFSVRSQAVKAVSSFLLIHEKDDPTYMYLADLLPPMIQVIAESIKKDEDDTIFKSLIDLAESAPKFLRPQLVTIISMCMGIMTNEEICMTWKHLALEVLVTLCENAPAMMRKEAARFIPTLVPLILNMMTDLEDEEDWSVSEELTDEDSDSNTVVAEAALDRLAVGLGGKTVLPVIVQNIPQMLGNQNWKFRHAALMALSAVGEGCYKQMHTILPQLMEGGILNFLRDPHPRVRYAACNAIGQMSTDFAPHFEKKFHDSVIPGLLMVLDDSANPRVQAHAGAALVNFSEDCPKNILVQYLDQIMAKLEGILSAKFKELVEKGTKLVLEQVVTTIASVADTSEEQFAAYYDRLMPCLKYIIQNAKTNELKMLRGKTIECVSLIGLAVGKDKFLKDATEVMDLLLSTHAEGEVPDDDPQTSYLISAWARICKILGKQFEQYLPLVIGPVMKAASHRPEVTVLDSDDLENVAGDDDWQFVSLGEQQNFGIKTAGIEDKASACDMLVCYARELKEGFAEYAEPVVKLMVPMLKFYFHDQVRVAAAQSLPCLLDCAKIKGDNFVLGMWNYIFPELIKAIEGEPETEVRHEHMVSMAKCIETLGKDYMGDERISALLVVLEKLLVSHFDRATERASRRGDEDYDEVVEEELENENNDDYYTVGKVADILHALFLTYGPGFYPYFDVLLGYFVRMLGTDMTVTDRQWGLCVFDDVIEYGGPACTKYKEYFLGPIIEGCTDRSPSIRQAASYGVGALAMHGGPEFAPACAEAVKLLAEVINHSESRSDENIHPTENAISAVTKILKHSNSAVNIDEVLPFWISWLPVWEDHDEAPHVYGYLCDLVEANNSIVLGPASSNLPRIIAIFAEALARDALPDTAAPVRQRVVGILRRVQQSTDIFKAIVSQLSSDLQVALHEALTSQPEQQS